MSASLNRGLDAWRHAMDAQTSAYFASCTHCGLCAEACLFYTETGDPRYTPIHKLAPMHRLWRREFTVMGRLAALLGFYPEPTAGELADWGPLVYDACTLCGRCAMVCPSGIDLLFLLRRMREGMALAGEAPPGLIHASQRTMKEGSPMGVSLASLQAQLRHVEQETGLPVPMDQAGSEYLVLFSSMEIIQFPETIVAVARIMDHAKASWTLASDAFEATNVGIQIGVDDIAAAIVRRTVTAAIRLGVKTVITPECGHAYQALRWEGPEMIGQTYPFQVLHIVELMDLFHRQGRLRLQGRIDEPLTYHDPCQIARKGGIVEQPRTLLNLLASDFREMPDAGVMNWCCGGGGGVTANERAEPLRTKVFQHKLNQIEALEVRTLVTACAVCHMTIEEGLEKYGVDVTIQSLTGLVADHLAPTP